MTKTRLARSTSRHSAPPTRETSRPTIFDLYEQVRDIVSPLELELRYAELDEHVSQLVDIIWTFVGALARAHGHADADWHVAERSFRDAIDECSPGKTANGTSGTPRPLMLMLIDDEVDHKGIWRDPEACG